MFVQKSRDPDRIQRMLVLLEQLWSKYPQLRLGQLLVNVEGRFNDNAFHLEDDQIEAGLRKVLDKGGFGG